MDRIRPLTLERLPQERRKSIERAEQLMGFVSNDSLTMARNPALMDAFAALVHAVYSPGEIESGMKRLLGMVTSSAAGCEYCTAHTVFASERHGIDADKIAAVWEFESSPLFTDAERAALRVAMHAGQTPNGVTDEMFEDLALHYTNDAQLEIVAVIALFGFLNRWNSTLRTELESLPRAALETARFDADVADDNE